MSINRASPTGNYRVIRWTIRGAAVAALLLTATPGAVHAQTVAPAEAAAARFYATRQNGPMWFRPGSNGEAAAQLATILRRAPLDGLANGPELASQVEAALVQART